MTKATVLRRKFYKEFEDRFRGNEPLIRERLQVYKEVLTAVKAVDPDPSGLDLGCGRGEWLTILRENDFRAHGIDLDAGMLEIAASNGLTVIQGDAIDHLSKQPTGSTSLITGFHVAEHLEFSKLQELIYHSHRILKAGGILILETPNPENLLVSTQSFHLDPTHRSPIPASLMCFLAEHYRFHRVKILRLQEETSSADASHLERVLKDVSPDYSIVAQKHAAENTLSAFDTIFSISFGRSLDDLLEDYRQFERGLLARISALEEYSKKIEEELATRSGEMETWKSGIEKFINLKLAENQNTFLRRLRRVFHRPSN